MQNGRSSDFKIWDESESTAKNIHSKTLFSFRLTTIQRVLAVKHQSKSNVKIGTHPGIEFFWALGSKQGRNIEAASIQKNITYPYSPEPQIPNAFRSPWNAFRSVRGGGLPNTRTMFPQGAGPRHALISACCLGHPSVLHCIRAHILEFSHFSHLAVKGFCQGGFMLPLYLPHLDLGRQGITPQESFWGAFSGDLNACFFTDLFMDF